MLKQTLLLNQRAEARADAPVEAIERINVGKTLPTSVRPQVARLEAEILRLYTPMSRRLLALAGWRQLLVR